MFAGKVTVGWNQASKIFKLSSTSFCWKFFEEKVKRNNGSAILSWTSRRGDSSGEWSRWAMSSSLFWTSGRRTSVTYCNPYLLQQTDTAWQSFCVWLMVDKSKGKFAHSKCQSHILFQICHGHLPSCLVPPRGKSENQNQKHPFWTITNFLSCTTTW